MFLEIGKLLLPHPAVVAYGCEYLQTGIQRAQSDFKAHLVVARSCAAVRHCSRSTRARNVREFFCLQAAFCADAEWVGAAPQNVARDQVTNDGFEELLFGVDQHMLDSPESTRAFFQGSGGVTVYPARVHAGRHYIPTMVFLQPRDAKRSIEAAGKGENYRGVILAQCVLHLRTASRYRSRSSNFSVRVPTR